MTLYEMMFAVGQKSYRDGTYESIIKTEDYLKLPQSLQIAFWDGATAQQRLDTQKAAANLASDEEVVYATGLKN